MIVENFFLKLLKTAVLMAYFDTWKPFFPSYLFIGQQSNSLPR